MAESFDIVIIGAGPVGLTLSTLLSRWGYKILHIDNRPTPTPTGRADGIQPRTLELLKNMRLKKDIMQHKPALVYEVAFWEADHMHHDAQADGNEEKQKKQKLESGEREEGDDIIVRTGTHPSCPDFIDTRYPFTTLLHQGLIERVFINDMEKTGTKLVRPWTISDFTFNDEDAIYPISVTIKKVVEGEGEEESKESKTETKTVKSKYLFGGEGVRSFVRQKMGIQMKYKDPTEYVWAVMDGVVKTTFPDIKMKCTIRSSHGSIMVIPREDNMVRLYIQLAIDHSSNVDPTDNYNSKANIRKTPASDVQAIAKKILHPYTIDWETVEWFSVYPIGQGVAEQYSGHNERVFIGGDATHTHSPKAGQGMNTAIVDAQNLAWKIHHVESNFTHRDILKTYESERKSVAERLLDFDSKYAKLFSGGGKASVSASSGEGGNEFIETFKKGCEFTSGYGVFYLPSNLNTNPQNLPNLKLTPGRMLPPSTVTRVVDANVVHLEQEVPLDGRWRIYLFTGSNINTPSSSSSSSSTTTTTLQKFTTFLSSPTSFYSTHPAFFQLLTIIPRHRPDIEIDNLPNLISSAKNRDFVYADDRRDYVWAKDVEKANVYFKYGLDVQDGGVVVVRPDGYVGFACKVEEAEDGLTRYFAKLRSGEGERVNGTT